MTNVYKIEVVVVDYDDLGEHGITRLIEGLRTPYTVLSYITNIQKAWVDDPDTVGRRQLIQQKLPELFSPWQPLDTAPRDGTRILFFYGDANAVFTAWYSKEYDYTYTGIQDSIPQEIAMYKYWHIASVDEDFPQYFDTENPANCYWQLLPELPI